MKTADGKCFHLWAQDNGYDFTIYQSTEKMDKVVNEYAKWFASQFKKELNVPTDEDIEQKILSNKEMEQIFHNYLDGTPLQYKSNLNPFEMFKFGYKAAQELKDILLPSTEDIKNNTPYFGKSCNKYWFEGAVWMRDEIIKRNK